MLMQDGITEMMLNKSSKKKITEKRRKKVDRQIEHENWNFLYIIIIII